MSGQTLPEDEWVSVHTAGSNQSCQSVDSVLQVEKGQEEEKQEKEVDSQKTAQFFRLLFDNSDQPGSTVALGSLGDELRSILEGRKYDQCPKDVRIKITMHLLRKVVNRSRLMQNHDLRFLEDEKMVESVMDQMHTPEAIRMETRSQTLSMIRKVYRLFLQAEDSAELQRLGRTYCDLTKTWLLADRKKP